MRGAGETPDDSANGGCGEWLARSDIDTSLGLCVAAC